MSDDLVKRLRDLGDHAALEPHMHHLAADRIEELEAKLAKAVEWAEKVRQYAISMDDRYLFERATVALAELKNVLEDRG